MERKAVQAGGGEARGFRVGMSSARGLAVLALLQVLCLWPFRRYVTDDTYIHLQFARNLAEGHGLSFQAGEPVYGFTSPLWVFLLAAGERLGAPDLPFARSLGLLATFGSVAAVHGLARIWIAERWLVWAATLAWAVDAWLLRWTFSGMETSLAVFLVAWGFLAHARARRDRTSIAPPMTIFALSALARPECLALVLLAWIDAVLAAWRVPAARRPRYLVEATLPFVLLLLPWMVYAKTEFGHLLPNSVAEKSPSLATSAWLVAHRLRHVLTLLGATRAVELGLLLLGGIALLRGLAGRATDGEAIRDALFERRLALVWLVVLLAGFAVRDSVLVSRYLLLVGPTTTVLAWAGLDWMLRDHPRGRNTVVSIAIVLVLLLNGWVLFGRALPHARAFPVGLERSVGEIADWLRDNTAADAVVASPDIGLLGYRCDRRILDLSGLVSPELLPLHRGRSIEEFVADLGFAESSRPDYLIDREIEPERLDPTGPHGERLEVVMVRPLGPLGLARRGTYHYTLYRIDWSEAKPVRP